MLGPLRLDELGFGAIAIGAIWLTAGVLETGNNVVIGRVADRRGPLAPVRVGLIGTVLATLILPWPENAYVLAFVIVGAAVAFGTFYTPGMTLLTHAAEHRGLDYGYAFALINLAWAPGQTAGSAVSGAVASVTSDAVPYVTLGVLAALTLAGLWRSRKLLVANRGEIALRVFRTARRLGIATVAVAAPDDEGSLHARSADERERVGSYLWSEEHIQAAHCARAPTRSIPATASWPRAATSPRRSARPASCGSARRRMRCATAATRSRRGGSRSTAGVPVVPGGWPEELGYPLLVKAAAGGGGRGMRVVRSPTELDGAVEAAGREAKAAFRDDRLLFERYLERPRHVEIQLLADAHGAVLALGERECSVQRRHQKLLEETPSTALDADLRARMADAAIRFARAVGYVGAGTAEFVLDGGRDFYFLELNGRIQVEHPVTEAVTGLDLVEQQIRVARGEPLDLHVAPSGHAVEVRLYAEDPRTFLPQAGRISTATAAVRRPRRRRRRGGRRGRHRLRPDAREADRARPDARGRARPPGRGARRDRGRGRDDEPAVPALARRAPRAASGRDDDRVPHRPPAALAPARAPAHARVARRVAAQPRASPTARRRPTSTIRPTAMAAARRRASSLVAPMPGTVIRVLVAPGDTVAARQPLVVLEAMKMETPLVAPYAATVAEVHVAEGDRVAGGAPLVELGA